MCMQFSKNVEQWITKSWRETTITKFFYLCHKLNLAHLVFFINTTQGLKRGIHLLEHLQEKPEHWVSAMTAARTAGREGCYPIHVLPLYKDKDTPVLIELYGCVYFCRTQWPITTAYRKTCKRIIVSGMHFHY